jgi:L-lysine 2,3-aminomutase
MQEVAIIKSGGEPVAAVDNKPEKIEEIKAMLKAIWPDDKVTVKIVRLETRTVTSPLKEES